MVGGDEVWIQKLSTFVYARDKYNEVGEQPRPLCEHLRTQTYTDITHRGTLLTSFSPFHRTDTTERENA